MKEKSAEENIEWARAQLQAGIDRLAAKGPQPSLRDSFEATELGPTELRRFFEYELEELGCFVLDLPLSERTRRLLDAETLDRMARHWVYRVKADRETVLALTQGRREVLLHQGYVDILAFIQDKQAQS